MFELYASVLGASGQVSARFFALNLSIFIGERMLLGDAAVRGYGSGGGWEYDVGICFDGRGDKDGRGYDVIQRYSIWYELIYLFLH